MIEWRKHGSGETIASAKVLVLKMLKEAESSSGMTERFGSDNKKW
jgi:hypothetical protein